MTDRQAKYVNTETRFLVEKHIKSNLLGQLNEGRFPTAALLKMKHSHTENLKCQHLTVQEDVMTGKGKAEDVDGLKNGYNTNQLTSIDKELFSKMGRKFFPSSNLQRICTKLSSM